jgi:hypothetical protein
MEALYRKVHFWDWGSALTFTGFSCGSKNSGGLLFFLGMGFPPRFRIIMPLAKEK